MLAFGTQQPGQTIALFLRPTPGEQAMKITARSSVGTPYLAEVSNHVANGCLGAVICIVLTQVANDLPVRGCNTQTFLRCKHFGKGFAPIRRVDQVTLTVCQYFMAPDRNLACNHIRVSVRTRSSI